MNFSAPKKTFMKISAITPGGEWQLPDVDTIDEAVALLKNNFPGMGPIRIVTRTYALSVETTQLVNV